MKNGEKIRSALIVVSVCFGSYIIHTLYASLRCPPPEVARERPISGTDWLVQMRVQGCGFSVDDMIDIRVIKRDGSNTIVLATGDDIDQIYLDTSQEQKLILAIPDKMKNVEFNHKEIPGVEVFLRFLTPSDNKNR